MLMQTISCKPDSCEPEQFTKPPEPRTKIPFALLALWREDAIWNLECFGDDAIAFSFFVKSDLVDCIVREALTAYDLGSFTLGNTKLTWIHCAFSRHKLPWLLGPLKSSIFTTLSRLEMDEESGLNPDKAKA